MQPTTSQVSLQTSQEANLLGHPVKDSKIFNVTNLLPQITALATKHLLDEDKGLSLDDSNRLNQLLVSFFATCFKTIAGLCKIVS